MSEIKSVSLSDDSSTVRIASNTGIFVLIVALAVLAAWLVPILEHHIAIDRCLDSGGSFNYKTYDCEHSKPVPRP